MNNPDPQQNYSLISIFIEGTKIGADFNLGNIKAMDDTKYKNLHQLLKDIGVKISEIRRGR